MRILALGAAALLAPSLAHADPWANGSPNDYFPGATSCESLATPYWTPCPGRTPDLTAPFNWLPGYIVGGRLDTNPIAPDLALYPDIRYWGTDGPNEQDGTPKLRARSLVLTDLGDTPDIQMRATGPDQGKYDGEHTAFRYKGSPTTVAKIYGQVLAPDCHGNLSFLAGCGHWGRTGVLEFGITAEPTATSRSSFMAWGNNPPYSADYRRDFYSADGQLIGLNAGSAESPVFAVRCGKKYCGVYGDTSGIKVSVMDKDATPMAGGGFSFPNNAQDTTLTLVVRKPGNVFETKPVSIGDANSCGTGYRCLKVSN